MAWNTEMPRTLLSYFDAIYVIHWSIRSLFLPSSKPKIPHFISIKLVKATRIKLRWNTTVVAFSECWKQKLLHSRASKVRLKATFCFVSACFPAFNLICVTFQYPRSCRDCRGEHHHFLPFQALPGKAGKSSASLESKKHASQVEE